MATILVYHLHLGTVSVSKSEPSFTVPDPLQILVICHYMKPWL